MSQLNKYVTKNEIEEFLDNLKLEDYTKEHEQIKTFVLQYMLKNPPGSDRVVQVGTFGKTPGSAAHSQNADGLIISYVCPRLIPLVGDQLKQKQIEGHHVCCRYDGSAKQYVIQIQFNETAPEKEAEAILDLGSIATKATEMGVSDFWSNLVMLIADEKGYGKGPQKVVFKRCPDSLLVAIGDFTDTADPDVKMFKALGREMSYTTFNEGVVFDIPINSDIPIDNEVQDNSEQAHVSIEQIVSQLKELGVDSSWIKAFMEYASANGFKVSLPNPKIERVGDRVCLRFGKIAGHLPSDSSKLKLGFAGPEMEWKINQYGGFFYIPAAVANGIEDDTPAVQSFVDNLSNPQTTQPQKETEMAYLPKTTIQILKPIYRDRLEKAGLSGEAIQLISDEIFHGSALKAPKEDSSFVVVAGKDALNVYYSHDNKSVTLTDIETTKTTSSGEVVSYSTGTSCAFFVVDTSNTRDKLIVKHVGVPKVKLELSSGYSVDLPFKKTYETIDRDQVLVRITCDALLSLSSKVLQNLTGPALTDLQETEPARYFIDGLQLTEKVFRKRTVPGAGSWADIE